MLHDSKGMELAVEDFVSIQVEGRSADVGYIEALLPAAGMVEVLWSQAGCGCQAPAEDPATLTRISESMYDLALDMFDAGREEGLRQGEVNMSRYRVMQDIVFAEPEIVEKVQALLNDPDAEVDRAVAVEVPA